MAHWSCHMWKGEKSNGEYGEGNDPMCLVGLAYVIGSSDYVDGQDNCLVWWFLCVWRDICMMPLMVEEIIRCASLTIQESIS